MTAADLLNELKSLCHDARVKRVIELARNPENEPIFAAFENGDGFSRRLALYSCHGSRNGARVARLSADKSRLVRHFAASLASVLCSGADLDTVFLNTRGRHRRHLLLDLLKRQRQDDVDRLCRLVSTSEAELLEIIPYASLPLVQEIWPTIPNTGYLDWTRLARFHPEYAFGLLKARLQTTEKSDYYLSLLVNVTIETGAERAPDAALDLLAACLRTNALTSVPYGPLMVHRPEALAQLVLSVTDLVHWDFSRRAHRLKPETVEQLLEVRPATLHQPVIYLKRMAPAQRARLYEKFGRGWRGTTAQLPLPLLKLLPRAIRQDEARRTMRLPSLAANPANWLPYAAFLPWDECYEASVKLLKDPDPDNRVAALRALIQSVRFERERAGELLTLVQARRFEQDPVRLAMLSSLAELPPSIWREEHLPLLAEVGQHALNARDLSYPTAAALERLIVGILPFHTAWAAEQVSILYQERGQVSFYALTNRVNDRQMRAMGPYLLPIFRAWIEREHPPFIGAMSVLGHRLKVWEEGVELLVQVAKNANHQMATSALSIIATHRRDVLADLIPQLLKSSSSWCTQPSVYTYLHRHRQDLLGDVALGRVKPSKRFWGGNTRFVLPVRDGFWRWTPEQQETFALTLWEVIKTSGRDLPSVIRAVEALTAMPDIDAGPLLQLASLENPREAIREGVIRTLSRLDAGQGLPVLLESLGDDRGRFAIYGLRRNLLEMPAEESLAVLREAPLNKVTVAKEVVRLIGDLRSPQAFQLLLEFESRDLHRDVRIALLRAAWEHLEDERIWPMLRRAAASEDASIATMAARTTNPRLSVEAKSKLVALLAGLMRHPELRVRLQAFQNVSSSRLSDPAGVLAAPISAALQSRFPAEYQTAASSLWAAYSQDRPDLIAESVRQLLPRRQALTTVIQSLVGVVRSAPRLFETASRGVLNVLQSDPLTLHLQLQLGAAFLSAADWAQYLEALDTSGTLHADALSAADQQLKHGGIQIAALPEIESRFAASPSPQIRRLALSALLGQANDGQGWTEARKTRLETYRRDTSPLVASAAQWTIAEPEAAENETESEVSDP